MEWNGPAPPKGSGLHRYIFIIYGHNDSLMNSTMPLSRAKFDVLKFAQKYSLHALNANFFVTQNKWFAQMYCQNFWSINKVFKKFSRVSTFDLRLMYESNACFGIALLRKIFCFILTCKTNQFQLK